MRYVFYHPETGELHPEVKSLSGLSVKDNTPKGFVALAHETAKPRHHCVDVTTGSVKPAPQPSAEHEWNEKDGRWELSAVARARATGRAEALAQILEIERSQARAVREALLDRPGALERLRELDRRIAELRSKL